MVSSHRLPPVSLSVASHLARASAVTTEEKKILILVVGNDLNSCREILLMLSM